MLRIVSLVLILTTSVFAADDLEKRLQSAAEHLQKGRYAEAGEALTALLSEPELSSADRTKIVIGLSRVHAEQGEYDQAVTVIRSGLEQNPDAAKLWARLAELQFHTGHLPESQASVEKALGLTSQQPLARLIQALLQVERGEIEGAVRSFQWFVQLYNRTQPNDAEVLLTIGEGSFEYAQLKSVTSIFKFLVNTLCADIRKADPLRWEADVLSGRLLLSKYNRGQASSEFAAALKINPNCAEAFLGQAQLALQDHDLDAADQAAEEALKRNPRLIDALLVRSDVRTLGAAPATARPFVELALAVNATDQRILARKSACDLIEDGLPAIADWQRSLKEPPAAEGGSERPQSRFLQTWSALVVRNPRPGYYLTFLGEALEAQRRFDHAEACYERAIEVAPQLSTPRTQLGLLYLRTGRTEEAEEILNAAFKSDPFHVRVSNMRKVIGVLKEYDTISTDHFVIRVDRTQRVLGQLMAEYLEEAYAELVQEFGFEPPHRTQFEIYADAKGQPAHAWFSARMIGLPWIQTIGASTGRIVALASPVNVESPFNWANVLKHEFVHVLTLQGTQFNIPHWYTEALAVRAEGTLLRDDWIPLLEERYPDRLFTLETINGGFQRPKARSDWDMAYCQSRLYADYLERTYGPEAPAKLLDAYRRQLNTEQALRDVFHVEQKQFETAFVGYVGEMLKAAKVGRSTPIPSFEESQKAFEAEPQNLDFKEQFAYRLLRTRKSAEDQKRAEDLAAEVIAKRTASPWAAIVIARGLLKDKKLDDARAVLTAALNRDDPNSEVLLGLAAIESSQKKDEELVRTLTLAHQKFPREIRFTEGLAAALGRLKRPEQQRPLLELVAAHDVDHVESRKSLMRIHWDAKDYPAAIRWAKEVLQIDVEDPASFAILAKSDAALGNHAAAEKAWRLLLLVDPAHLEAPLGLAQALADQGKSSEAREQLKSVLKQQPNNAKAKQLLDDLAK